MNQIRTADALKGTFIDVWVEIKAKAPEPKTKLQIRIRNQQTLANAIIQRGAGPNKTIYPTGIPAATILYQYDKKVAALGPDHAELTLAEYLTIQPEHQQLIKQACTAARNEMMERTSGRQRQKHRQKKRAQRRGQLTEGGL